MVGRVGGINENNDPAPLARTRNPRWDRPRNERSSDRPAGSLGLVERSSRRPLRSSRQSRPSRTVATVGGLPRRGRPSPPSRTVALPARVEMSIGPSLRTTSSIDGRPLEPSTHQSKNGNFQKSEILRKNLAALETIPPSGLEKKNFESRGRDAIRVATTPIGPQLEWECDKINPPEDAGFIQISVRGTNPRAPLESVPRRHSSISLIQEGGGDSFPQYVLDSRGVRGIVPRTTI